METPRVTFLTLVYRQDISIIRSARTTQYYSYAIWVLYCSARRFSSKRNGHWCRRLRRLCREKQPQFTLLLLYPNLRQRYCMLYCCSAVIYLPNTRGTGMFRGLTWIPPCESKAMTCSSDLGLSIALRQVMGYLSGWSSGRQLKPAGNSSNKSRRPDTAAKN